MTFLSKTVTRHRLVICRLPYLHSIGGQRFKGVQIGPLKPPYKEPPFNDQAITDGAGQFLIKDDNYGNYYDIYYDKYYDNYYCYYLYDQRVLKHMANPMQLVVKSVNYTVGLMYLPDRTWHSYCQIKIRIKSMKPLKSKSSQKFISGYVLTQRTICRPRRVLPEVKNL